MALFGCMITTIGDFGEFLNGGSITAEHQRRRQKRGEDFFPTDKIPHSTFHFLFAFLILMIRVRKTRRCKWPNISYVEKQDQMMRMLFIGSSFRGGERDTFL